MNTKIKLQASTGTTMGRIVLDLIYIARRFDNQYQNVTADYSISSGAVHTLHICGEGDEVCLLFTDILSVLLKKGTLTTIHIKMLEMLESGSDIVVRNHGDWSDLFFDVKLRLCLYGNLPEHITKRAPEYKHEYLSSKKRLDNVYLGGIKIGDGEYNLINSVSDDVTSTITLFEKTTSTFTMPSIIKVDTDFKSYQLPLSELINLMNISDVYLSHYQAHGVGKVYEIVDITAKQQ